MIEQLQSFLYGVIWPRQSLKASLGQFYGYRWQPGAGVPNQLTIFNGSAGGGGLYVGLTPETLAMNIDYFGRYGGAGTVFTAPLTPLPAVAQLIQQLQADPSESDAYDFSDVTPQRLQDISGFLSYVNTCMTLINSTAAGSALLGRINATGYPVLIMPRGEGGNTAAPTVARGLYMNTLAQNLLSYFRQEPWNPDVVNAAIAAMYPGLEPGGIDMYNQLAAALNALPLYSLFEYAAQSQPDFLGQYFQFMGQAVTGQNLMDWLSANGSDAFNLNLFNFDGNVQGAWVNQYFILALIILLDPYSLPNAGGGTRVNLNVRNEDANQQGNPDFRPPAIGLAHELIHAMYNAEGDSPGEPIFNYSTTAVEMLAVGLGPYADQPISENAIRAQWGTIPKGVPIDPSNTWNNPTQRTIYDAPTPELTVQQLRNSSRSI